MRFLFDNDISYRYADMLRALDVDVRGLRAVMPHDTKDPDFLGDWKNKYDVDVFVSNNSEQRRNLVEAALLKTSGVTSLYFNPFWSKLLFWPQAEWLIKHWPRIEGFVRGVERGTCADIKQNGTMRVFHL